jgi:hypothetical protein
MLSLDTSTLILALGTFMGLTSAQDCDMNHLLQSLPTVQQACCLQVPPKLHDDAFSFELSKRRSNLPV